MGEHLYRIELGQCPTTILGVVCGCDPSTFFREPKGCCLESDDELGFFKTNSKTQNRSDSRLSQLPMDDQLARFDRNHPLAGLIPRAIEDDTIIFRNTRERPPDLLLDKEGKPPAAKRAKTEDHDPFGKVPEGSLGPFGVITIGEATVAATAEPTEKPKEPLIHYVLTSLSVHDDYKVHRTYPSCSVEGVYTTLEKARRALRMCIAKHLTHEIEMETGGGGSTEDEPPFLGCLELYNRRRSDDDKITEEQLEGLVRHFCKPKEELVAKGVVDAHCYWEVDYSKIDTMPLLTWSDEECEEWEWEPTIHDLFNVVTAGEYVERTQDYEIEEVCVDEGC